MNTLPNMGSDTGPNTDDQPEPANLKFLRRLVTLLTATMILGVGLITVLLFLRLTQSPSLAPGISLPQEIELPAGTQMRAITAAPDWYAIVTTKDEILIFDRASGALRQTVTVLPAE